MFRAPRFLPLALLSLFYCAAALAGQTILFYRTQPVPSWHGYYGLADKPVMNNRGLVPVTASGEGTPLVGLDKDMLLLIDTGTGAIQEVIRENTGTPTINGLYDFFKYVPPSLNEQGEAYFVSSLRNTLQGVQDHNGLFMASTGSVVEVTRKGNLPANGNGKLGGFTSSAYQKPQTLNAGGIIYLANIQSSTNSSSAGFFEYDGSTHRKILRKEDYWPQKDAYIELAAPWGAPMKSPC